METWMTIDEFLQAIKKKAPPAPAGQLAQLEGAVGGSWPDDYRRILETCNGGDVGGSPPRQLGRSSRSRRKPAPDRRPLCRIRRRPAADLRRMIKPLPTAGSTNYIAADPTKDPLFCLRDRPVKPVGAQDRSGLLCGARDDPEADRGRPSVGRR